MRPNEETGYTLGYVGLLISREQTEEFLDWMGEPPTGFEYKWENNNREEYDRLKKTIYTNGDN